MPIKEKIDDIFNNISKDSTVAILLQQAPDPDALGSAAGFAVLLKEVYDLNSKIYHFGELSHPQNKAMRNTLHIALKDGREFSKNVFGATVVLDTDLSSTGFKTDTFNRVDVRIDHHSMERDDDPRYSDIRAVGSTCSIIWEYLNTFEIDLSKYQDVCTAMVLGITTDTLDFTSNNTDELDMEAYRNLLPYINKAALAKVSKFTLPKQIFEAETLAYRDRRIKGTALTTFIGQISAHDRDVIATIADRFSRMEGINTVVVMAVVDSDLHASIRSDDSRVEVSDLCYKVFGKNFSGAKEGAGGARVPLGKAFEMITNEEVRSSVMDEIVANISESVFAVLGIKE